MVYGFCCEVLEKYRLVLVRSSRAEEELVVDYQEFSMGIFVIYFVCYI